MTVFFSAEPPIPLHALGALLALIIGAVQLLSVKGSVRHKYLGRVWVLLMVFVAASSFFIYELKVWGNYSPIHLLSAWTIFALWLGVFLARRGNIRSHKMVMISMYFLALVLTGLFTLLPGRLMHHVIFG